MHRKLRTAFVLAGVIAASACDDGTSPRAPGAIKVASTVGSAVSVQVDGRSVGTLEGALQVVADSLEPGRHEARLSGSGIDETVRWELAERGTLGVVVMNAEAPEVRTYDPGMLNDSGVNILLINAVPGSTVSMELEGGTRRAQVAGLVYGEAAGFDFDHITFDVVVSTPSTGDVDLGSVRLPLRHSFIVVYPTPGEELPLAVVVF